MDGVVQQGDGMSQDAAKNFGDDQTKSGHHGPSQDGWSHGWMGMIVAMRVTVLVTVFMLVVRFLDVHPLYSTSFAGEVQPLGIARYWEV